MMFVLSSWFSRRMSSEICRIKFIFIIYNPPFYHCHARIWPYSNPKIVAEAEATLWQGLNLFGSSLLELTARGLLRVIINLIPV